MTDDHRYACLVTLRRNGTAVKTPVWFAAAGDTLYVFSAGEAGKVKRLRHSPRVRVAPCDARGRAQGPWHDGTGRIVSDAGMIERAHAALRAKYGWQLRLLDFFSWLTGRIRSRAWIEIELTSPARP
jgi:PPOX class probable F420-dependent enzyme